MGLKAFKVTVTDQPTLLTGDTNGTAGRTLIRVPTTGHTLWIGGPDVNATTRGFPLYAGENFDDNVGQEDVYAVVALADVSQDVYVYVGGA